MDQIFIRCAREAAAKRMDEGNFRDALQILEALEAQGEKQGLTDFCREMSVLEGMALSQWRRDMPEARDIMHDCRIRMLLGEGGQSWNYLVEDREGQWLAMKVRKAFRPHGLWPEENGTCPSNLEGVEKIALLRECLEPFLLQKLSGHPNVVALKDWRLGRVHGMATAHIFTEPLLPLPFYTGHDAARLGLDICSALCEMHRQNFFHRDIKPENVYVSRDGRFKLGDFGSAVMVSGGVGNDGRRQSFMAANFDDTIPVFRTAGPFWDVPPAGLGAADPAELTAYDIRSLGHVMAHLLLRDRCGADSLEARGPASISEYRELFEASEVGRIILRAAETTTACEPDGPSVICKGYASVEEMRQALQSAVGAPEDVRGDFDRFFAMDCRARLIIERPFSEARLHDGRPVESGTGICFRLMHYGHEGPDVVSVTRRMTLTPVAFDVDRVTMKRGDLPYGSDESQVLDPNRFQGRSEVEITAKYPDGFGASWTVTLAAEPRPIVPTPPEPPEWDGPDTIWE